LKYSKKLSKKYKLVIDANIIISAIFGGYPEKALEIAISHEVFAPIILEKELNKFIEKVRKKKEFPNLRLFFNYILNHINLVTVEKLENITRDKTDDFYIAVAIQEEVDFLITGDKDLLSCKDIRKWSFKILSPKEFIEVIRNS
jgi:putative PIN family toxin of toxin-antitoxin system